MKDVLFKKIKINPLVPLQVGKLRPTTTPKSGLGKKT